MASGFDHETLIRLIGDRIAFVPRYRQRVRRVPGHVANPVWADDPHFDLTYHVRRSALPRPGTIEQLRELVARIVSRPLDRQRPLWEVYLVEGLEDGRVAVLTKAHQALVDGAQIVDLAQVLLDRSPEPRELGADDWHPGRPVELDRAARSTPSATRSSSPITVLDTARGAADTWSAGAEARPPGVDHGAQRADQPAYRPRHPDQRHALAAAPVRDRAPQPRRSPGGPRRPRWTVNDVVLATVTGGLRTWLMARAESLGGLRQVRAVVPVSVHDHELEATSVGSQIAPHFVDLPVGEPSPVIRLHQVSYSFKAHKETGRAVAANRIAGVAGFAPSTFHAIGSRVAAEQLRRGIQLSVTNVPGAAVAAVRRRRGDGADLPGAAAAAATRPRDRRHVVRRAGVLRRHRRP